MNKSKDQLNSTRIEQSFFKNFSWIVALFGLAYSVLFYYLDAKAAALSFVVMTIFFYPTLILLNKKDHHVTARLLLIVYSLLLIYSSKLTIQHDLREEYYYIPAMMLAILLFQTHQKKEIFLGTTLPIITWGLGKWGPLPELPSHLLPKAFPSLIFQNLNFAGSLAITLIFLNFYMKYLIRLKELVEADLKKSKIMEQNLEAAQRVAKIGNWDFTASSNELYWSKEHYKIFELEHIGSDKLFQAYKDRLHPDDRENVESLLNNAIINGEKFEFEYRIVVQNEDVKYILSRGEPVFDTHGAIKKFFGTAQDITEQKQLSIYLCEQQNALAHNSKMASLGEMAGGIAHEINNPLAIIQGKAVQLLRSLENDKFEKDKLQTDIYKIIATVKRITAIINSLKSITRNSSGDSKQLVAMKTIIEVVLELSRDRFKHSNVALECNIAQDAQIMCRPSEIEQVVLNLINNSLDAVLHLEEKWVRIEVIEKNLNIQVIVTDSGFGIPEQVLEKLMQPFFTTKEVGKGTGLGLSISKGIVSAHDGKLYYNKQSPRTSFIIEIPILEQISGAKSA